MAVISTYSAVLRYMLDIFSPTVRWVRFSNSALKNAYMISRTKTMTHKKPFTVKGISEKITSAGFSPFPSE